MRSLLGALVRRTVNQAPVPYSPRSFRWAPPWFGRNDAEAQLRAMETTGTLFAIIDRLASSTAQVEWKLWRTAKSGLDEDRIEVTRHLALDIWRKPNPFMPQAEFVEVFQQHLDLTGEGWWVVARNPQMRSIPLELWPVRPDRMLPVPDPEQFISGYIYRSPDGEQVPLRLDEVIMLRRPHPLDPYRGASPVRSILTDLDGSRSASEWNRNFFHNSAQPGGVIEVPEKLDDTQFDELRDRWEEQHRGTSAAHRVAILEGGMRWIDRKFTQRDMQFAELGSLTREVVREAYAIHGHTLGLSDNVNRANAEAADTTFARWQIKPRAERIKQALNHDFLPLFGATADGLEFDYTNPVPEDREADNAERSSKAGAAATLVTAGWEPAGVLSAVGLPEIPFVGRTDPGSLAARRRALPAASVPLVLGDATQEEAREDWEDRLDTLLEDWAGITADQIRELAVQIRALVDAGDRAGVARLTASSTQAAEVLEAVLIAQAEAAGERMVETADEQGVTITAAVVTGVLAATLAGTATAVAGLLAAGLATAAGAAALRMWAPGMDTGEVVDRVAGYLEDLPNRTLRAELGGAIWSAEGAGRFATLEQAEADGVGATGFTASEIRDLNTCDLCKRADGRHYDTLAEAQSEYPNGGYWACKGGARCRGTIEPVWSGS
jgi:HK97 family phage portal protein